LVGIERLALCSSHWRCGSNACAQPRWMLHRIAIAFVVVVFAAAAGAADSKPASSHVLKLDAAAPRAMAKLADVAWLIGHWRGKGFGGDIEETWLAPNGSSMAGLFRLMNGGQAQIYEIFTIVEEEGSLALRLKHFTGALKAWEDKETLVNFPLVKLEPRAAYFAGLTYKLEGGDTLRVWLSVGKPGDLPKQEQLVYQRVKGPR